MASVTDSATRSAIRIVSGVASKPIRVDNWGNFLAQRIEALYDKQEHCDLTLRFPHGDLKAHSLVLHACTPFFTNLLKGKTTGHKILKMPPQISSLAMGVILKFVYTGRLEAPFSVEMLYSTAKLLKLQVLVRLLEAQMSSAEKSISAGRLAMSPSRRGRPPYGCHRLRTGTDTGYQPTNSQLAAKRTPVRAADPPGDVRPSRFELPDSNDVHLRLPVLESGLLRPKSEPRADSSADTRQVIPTGRETLFEHLHQMPTKRAAPQQQNGAQKRPKLEAGDAEPDVTVLREYCEEQRQRAELLEEQHSTDQPPSKDGEAERHQSLGTPVTPRPILKQESTPAGASGGKKRVQFSESPQLTLTVQDMGDTSELLSQLLKQHPDVLRGGQNVKVRLVAQGGPGSFSSTEFMMVKQLRSATETTAVATRRSGAGTMAETLDAPLSCSLCAQKGRQIDFWWADQMAKHFYDEHSDASAIDLNTLSCTVCVKAGDPIDFVAVTDYFAHLRDVHDARGVSSAGTCQLCGFSANKKLQLIYHQYIKHNIRPPRFITFPRCDRCDFEAISDSEMAHHRQRRHKIGKEYKCKECGLIFSNVSLLEGHMRTNSCPQSSDEKRRFEWKCEFCGMSFSRSYNLKGHMRSVHKMSVERRRIVQPAVTVKQETAPLAPSATLDPSSEAESLSTVANSVAASLNLAVDGDFMALPDGVVPVEDENGLISYVSLRPTDCGGGDGVSDGTVLEVAQYTVPLVVGTGGTESITVQVVPAADGHGPGASAGESVLPDLAVKPQRPQNIDLPQTTEPRTLVSLAQLQMSLGASRVGSQLAKTRGERRRLAADGPGGGSSRISVSSSEVTVSDLHEPSSILPHLPGEPLPGAVSERYVTELQPGQIVMTDGMSAGHVIVSEVASGQNMIVTEMAPGRLYEPQQPITVAPSVSRLQHVAVSQSQDIRDSVQSRDREDVTKVRGSDVSALATCQGLDVAGDTQQVTATQEPLAADMSRVDEFIGPDALPEDVDISNIRPVQTMYISETGEHGASRSGTPLAEELDVPAKKCSQNTDASKADLSPPELHSAGAEAVHLPPGQETVVCQEQMNLGMDERVTHYHSGEESVACVKQPGEVDAVSVAHQLDGDESVLLGNRSQSVADSPDGSAAGSKLVLVLEKEGAARARRGGPVVLDAADQEH